jgi:hypothetical protein
MPMLTRPAFGPAAALAYVTGGALLCVWTAVWYFTRETELTRSQWFWVAGFFLTGTTFVFLGLILGPLGRAARQAELPPAEATRAEAAIQQTAAANPPVVTAPQTATAVPPQHPAAVAPAAVPSPTAPTIPVRPAPVS